MQTVSKRKQPAGMTAFMIVWVGQFISLLGTGMTRFAITLWAWEMTGQATTLALVAFFGFAPSVVMMPFAGAIVDRYNRKLMMMVSDFGAGLGTIVLFTLSLNDSLAIWHLYVVAAFIAIFEAFQFPAYSSAISMMVEKKHYARTSALMGLAGSASGIIAPIAAAALYAIFKLDGILLIDMVTFSFALLTLALIYVPQPPPSAEGESSKGSIWSESAFGFRYIWRRKSLLGLQMLFFGGNLLFSMAFVLLSPMILSRTGNNQYILGSVMSAFGIGGVIGGVFISVWGGPKRRVYGVAGGWILSGLTAVAMGLGNSTPVWIAAALGNMVFGTLINASNQAIWQSKVPPDVQGRVFSVRALIAQVTAPLAMLIAGPLADYVFEPGMMPGGALADLFGPLVGTGTGAGIALIFVFCGLLTGIIGLLGLLHPAIRNVEDIVPDHQERMEAPFTA